jgi:hypothetical protein
MKEVVYSYESKIVLPFTMILFTGATYGGNVNISVTAYGMLVLDLIIN